MFSRTEPKEYKANIIKKICINPPYKHMRYNLPNMEISISGKYIAKYL
jgi:hypothetical protein